MLARILDPADFGTVVFANFFYSLIARLKDHGFDGALIHRADEVQTAANTHLVLHVSICGLIVVIAALAFPILAFFHSTTVGWIVLANALIFLLGSPSMTTSRLLDKEMRYGRISILGIVGNLLAAFSLLSLAFMGWGLWALVFGGVPTRIWAVAASWRWAPLRPRIKLDWDMAKWYFRFGPYWLSVVSGLSTLVIEQVHNFLVGSLVGFSAVGFMSRAYGWADLPTQRVTHIISGTAFPVYAKLQSERERLSYAFRLVQRAVARLSFPLAIYLVLVIPFGTRFLIGERWLPVAPIFQIFAVYMFTRPLYDDIKLLLTAVGELRLVNRIQVTMAVLMLAIAPLLVITAPALLARLPSWVQAWARPQLEAAVNHEWREAIAIGTMHVELAYAPLEAAVYRRGGSGHSHRYRPCDRSQHGHALHPALCGRAQHQDLRPAVCRSAGCGSSDRRGSHILAAHGRRYTLGDARCAYGSFLFCRARPLGGERTVGGVAQRAANVAADMSASLCNSASGATTLRERGEEREQ